MIFHRETQQENIREGNLYFPKYISFSQSSVHTRTIRKFELANWENNIIAMLSLRASNNLPIDHLIFGVK